MTRVLGEPPFGANIPYLRRSLLDYTLRFFPPACVLLPLSLTEFRVYPEEYPTPRRCHMRILSFVTNDIDSQWVEAPDCLCANELKSEQQHLDPQPIHQQLHGLY